MSKKMKRIRLLFGVKKCCVCVLRRNRIVTSVFGDGALASCGFAVEDGEVMCMELQTLANDKK